MNIATSQVKQRIYTYISHSITDTEIKYDYAKSDHASETWLVLHSLARKKIISKVHQAYFQYLFQISLFSTIQSAYLLDNLEDRLRSILENRELVSENYWLYIQEIDSVELKQEKTIQGRAMTLTVIVQNLGER